MRRALVIDHPPATLPDRVSLWLAAHGWSVARVCLEEGGTLPEPEAVDAVVLLGGRPIIGEEQDHPSLREEYRFVDRRLQIGAPMLGFGLGAQVIAHVLGAAIGPLHSGEVEMGWFPVRATAAGAGLMPPQMTVFEWHSQGFGLPFGATRLAASPLFPNQGARFAPGVYGFQFRADLPPAGQEELLASIGHEPWTERASPAEHSRVMAAEHDAAMERWLGRFVGAWLAEAGLAARTVRETGAA